MVFQNPKTRTKTESIIICLEEFCLNYLCDDCPIKARAGNIRCFDFARQNPVETAHIIGYEILDEPGHFNTSANKNYNIPMHTTSLGGRDSLYSIVQMPSGIPVATVAINGGANAGILAAKILAVSDPALLQKLKEYSEEMKEGVLKKDEKLKETGWANYAK